MSDLDLKSLEASLGTKTLLPQDLNRLAELRRKFQGAKLGELYYLVSQVTDFSISSSQDLEKIRNLVENFSQYSMILKKLESSGKTISLDRISRIPNQQLTTLKALLSPPTVSVEEAIEAANVLPAAIKAIQVTDYVKAFPNLKIMDALELLRAAPAGVPLFPTLTFIKRKFPEADSDKIKRMIFNYHDILQPYAQLSDSFPSLTLQQADTIRELVMDPKPLIDLKSRFKELSVEDLEEIHRFSQKSLSHSTQELIRALNRFEENEKMKGASVKFRDAFKYATFAAELKKKTEEVYFHRIFPKLTPNQERELDKFQKQNIAYLKEFFPDFEIPGALRLSMAPDLDSYKKLEHSVDAAGLSKTQFREHMLRLVQNENIKAYAEMIVQTSNQNKSKITFDMLDELANLPQIDCEFVVSHAVRDPAGFFQFMRAHGNLDHFLYETQRQLLQPSNSSPRIDGSDRGLFNRALDAEVVARFRTEVEGACPAFDYQRSFTPQLRHQGELGTCWAHTASDLLGQKLCQYQPEYCGKAISASDLSQAFRDVYAKSNGGTISGGLSYGLKNGVCFEDDTTYFRAGRTFDDLRGFYLEQKATCSKHSVPAEEFNEMMTSLNQIVAKISSEKGGTVGVRVSTEQLFNAITSSESYPDYIYKLLIKPQCHKQRVGAEIHPHVFDGLSLERIVFDIDTHSYLQRLQALKKNSGNQSAFALGVCANQALKISGDCGEHAISLIAAKFDHTTGKCMGFLRNSWGNSPELNGWHDLSEILKLSDFAGFLGDPSARAATR